MVSRNLLQLLTAVSLVLIGAPLDVSDLPLDQDPSPGTESPYEHSTTFEYSVEPTEITDEGPDQLNDRPLEYIDKLYDMTRNLGREAILSCRIRGTPPMNLYILHDRIATFKMKNKKRNLPCETIYDPDKPDELAVVYRLENLQEKHEGVYKCQGESITGQVTVSTMVLTLVDPCDSIECGFMEQCVNVKGNGICTCDFECSETYDPVCGDGITYSSMCHLDRSQCRRGAYAASIEPGACAKVEVVPTKANCTLSGEGHVSMFNGDYFSFRGIRVPPHSGACPYKMVEDTRGGTFIVYAMTELCGDDSKATCLRSITMYVDRIYGFSIERGWLINDNGRRRNVMPGEQIILGGGAVSITRIGKTMVGRIENKQIQFYYDGLNYFKVSVPLDFVEREDDFRGFCGSIPVDHVPTSIGRDISTVSDVPMPSLGSEELCRPQFGSPECTDPNIPRQVRDVLSNNEDIARCATTVPIDLYMDRAVKDTCACAHREDLNYCFCNILYVYAEECRQWGVDISLASIGGYCANSFHKQVFKAEGLDFKRHRWYYATGKKRGH